MKTAIILACYINYKIDIFKFNNKVFFPEPKMII